jgi:hypothetical protein
LNVSAVISALSVVELADGRAHMPHRKNWAHTNPLNLSRGTIIGGTIFGKRLRNSGRSRCGGFGAEELDGLAVGEAGDDSAVVRQIEGGVPVLG